MAARIGMSSGKEWVVEGEVDAVASSMWGPDPFTVITTNEGQRVYVLRAHVAYVEEEMPLRSVYEDRGITSIDPDS